MSYTPEQQLLHDRIEEHIKSGDELERAMRARVDDTGEWKQDHLDELDEVHLKGWSDRRRNLRGVQARNR